MQLKLKTTPYKYQQEVIDNGTQILLKNNFVALLLSMGLGKTLSSLYISANLYAQSLINSLIVICPKSLIGVWLNEIEKHISDDLSIIVWDSTKIKTKTYQKQVSQFLSDNNFKIFIVNVEAFQTVNSLFTTLFSKIVESCKSFCVLDESTKIKNNKANRTKNVIKLTKTIKYKAILTGTCVTNSILDLYCPFYFLHNRFWSEFKNFYAFRARYCILIDIQTNTRSFPKVVGFKKVDELKAKIEPYSIQLTKEECLDLPDKIYCEIPIDMNKEQRRVYDELKSKLWIEYKDHLLVVKNKVSLFMRFRQITNGFLPESNELIGERCEKLFTLLEDVEEYSDKIVIFSSFTAPIKYIHKEILKEFGENSIVSFTGQQSQNEKDSAVDLFVNNKDCKFIILNSQSGAFGLNLQNSSLCYYFDRSLSIEQNLQSEDRLHRIGQKNNVVYKDLICKDSVDEKIQKLLKQKINLINEFNKMNVEDIFDLI